MKYKVYIKKLLIYSYILWIVFGLPPLLGVSITSYFETMYGVFTYKWLAKILICFFFGSIVTALPICLLIEISSYLPQSSINSLIVIIIIGWVVAIIVPFAGFEFLSLALIVLIWLTIAISFSEIFSVLKNKKE